MQEKRPYLLGITIYSVLVLQFILLMATVLIFLWEKNMESVQAFIYSSEIIGGVKWHLIFGLFFNIIFIYSNIQMLRRKVHGMYLAFSFSLLLILFLLLSNPIDFFNIFIILLINYIYYMYRSWFQGSKAEDTENVSKSDS